MAAKVTANPNTRIIEITAAPSGGLLEINVVDDIYEGLKDDWLATPSLQVMRFPFRTIGDPTGPGESIGPYVFLDNTSGWRILPYDADHELSLVGGNLVAESNVEGSSFGLINPRSGRTILVRDKTSAQALALGSSDIEIAAAYQAAVWIDETRGQSGTSFPIGIATSPVSNIADARTIADAQKIATLRLQPGPSGYAITGTWNYYNFLSVSDLSGKNPFIYSSGAVNVQNCNFQGVNLLGTMDGVANHARCQINAGRYGGSFDECDIVGAIIPQAASFDFSYFNRCTWRFSGALNYAGRTDSGITVYGGGGTMAVRNMQDASNALTIDGFYGVVTIENSCTAGTITIRGPATVVNNGAGVTVVDEADRTFTGYIKWLGTRDTEGEFAALALRDGGRSMRLGTVDDSTFTPTVSEFEATSFDAAADDPDHFRDRRISFVSGTLIWQARDIVATQSLGSGKIRFTCDPFTDLPANGDQFRVI